MTNLRTESFAYEMGKALVKGFLIIPALLDDEEDFMKEFYTDASKLEDRWLSLRDTLAASLDSRLAEAVRPFTRVAMQRIDALFDACDEAGVRLEDVEAVMAAQLIPPDEAEG